MNRAAIVLVGVGLLVLAWLLWTRTPAPTADASAPHSKPAVPREAISASASVDETPAVHDDEANVSPPADPTAAVDPARGCALAHGDDPRCPFLEPDDATMQEMARCGIARFDIPVRQPSEAGLEFFPEAWRTTAGVGAAEHERLERAAATFMSDQRRRWTELAAQAGIDRDWAEGATASVVFLRIASEYDEDQIADAVGRIARERAGEDPSEDPVPAPLEAAVRLRADAGEAFEAALADVVGPSRAAELRAAGDGWPGGHGWIGNRCPIEPPAPPGERFVPTTPSEAKACVDDPKARGCGFADPTQDELDRLADCGMVRIELPSFVGDRFSEPTFDPAFGWSDEVGLTPKEAAAFAEIGEQVREALYDDLAQLAVEAGKPAAWTEQTPFIGMMVAIMDASPSSPAQTEALLRRLAEERAGRTSPPTDLSGASLEERFMRRILQLADDLESAAAERFGSERAGQLRRAHDGWPGVRNQTENYCTGTEPLFF